MRTPCKVDQCERPTNYNGYCHTHWYRVKTHGSVLKKDLKNNGEPHDTREEKDKADNERFDRVEALMRREESQRVSALMRGIGVDISGGL
jgi:hypothetical protein